MGNAHEIYALRYATMSPRTPAMNFLSPDPHETAAQDLDYFVWLIRGRGRDILVDTGFNAEEASLRARKLTLNPIDALERFGVDGQVRGAGAAVDLGPHPRRGDRHDLPVDLHLASAFDEQPSPRARRLVAGDEQRVLGVGEALPAVVEDPASREHAARGDDDERALRFSRLLDRSGDLLPHDRSHAAHDKGGVGHAEGDRPDDLQGRALQPSNWCRADQRLDKGVLPIHLA